jgi:hypothetical protein
LRSSASAFVSSRIVKTRLCGPCRAGARSPRLRRYQASPAMRP